MLKKIYENLIIIYLYIKNYINYIYLYNKKICMHFKIIFTWYQKKSIILICISLI